MPDALIGYHTLPGETRAARATANVLECRIAEDEMEAERLHKIMQTAALMLDAAEFHGGCPVRGYDIPSILEMLCEMGPAVDDEMRARIRQQNTDAMADYDPEAEATDAAYDARRGAE